MSPHRVISSVSILARAEITFVKALIIALIGFSSGCTKIPSTQVTLVLFSDDEIAAELEEMALDIFGAGVGEPPLLTGTLQLRGDELPASIALVPHGGDASRQFGAEARASNAEGRLRAIVRARGSYMENEARTAYLRFDAECLDILDCSNDETCSLGRCVSSALQPEDYGVLEREGGFRMPPRAIKDRVILARGDEHHFNPLANDLDPDGGELRLLAIAYEHEEDAGEVEFEFSENGETILRAIRGGESEAIDLIYTLANGAGLRARGRVEVIVGEPAGAIVCQEGEWIRALDDDGTLARCEPFTICEPNQQPFEDELPTGGTSRSDVRCCHYHEGKLRLGGENVGWPEFDEECLRVGGSVVFDGPYHTPARGGEALIRVDGDVWAMDVDLENLNALQGLHTVGEEHYGLVIDGAPRLSNIDALSSLERVDGSLYLVGLDELRSIAPLSSLRHLGSIWFSSLPELTSLHGLEGLEELGALWLESVRSLGDLTGLDNLRYVDGNFWLHSLISLTSLRGLGSLTSAASNGTSFQSSNNPLLCRSEVEDLLASFDPPASSLGIYGGHREDCEETGTP